MIKYPLISEAVPFKISFVWELANVVFENAIGSPLVLSFMKPDMVNENNRLELNIANIV